MLWYCSLLNHFNIQRPVVICPLPSEDSTFYSYLWWLTVWAVGYEWQQIAVLLEEWTFVYDTGTAIAKKLALKRRPACSTWFMWVVNFHFRECAASAPKPVMVSRSGKYLALLWTDPHFMTTDPVAVSVNSRTLKLKFCRLAFIPLWLGICVYILILELCVSHMCMIFVWSNILWLIFLF